MFTLGPENQGSPSFERDSMATPTTLPSNSTLLTDQNSKIIYETIEGKYSIDEIQCVLRNADVNIGINGVVGLLLDGIDINFWKKLDQENVRYDTIDNFVLINEKTNHKFSKDYIFSILRNYRPPNGIEGILSLLYDQMNEMEESRKIECKICCNQLPRSQFQVLGCGNHHEYCLDCIKYMISQSIEENTIAKCFECQGELSLEEIGVLFPEKEDEYNEMLFKMQLNQPGYIQCPCGFVMATSQRGKERSECWSCHKVLCSMCRENYHYRTTCEEFIQLRHYWFAWLQKGRNDYLKELGQKEDMYNQNLSEFEAARKKFQEEREIQLKNFEILKIDEERKAKSCRGCPTCGRWIEKMEGCDKMICGRDWHGGNIQNGCGAKFKWEKAKPYRAMVPNTLTLQEFTEKAPEKAKDLIHEISCDLCSNQIRGLLFSCINCPSFNVCESCEKNGLQHNSTHIDIPQQFTGGNGHLGTSEIIKHCTEKKIEKEELELKIEERKNELKELEYELREKKNSLDEDEKQELQRLKKENDELKQKNEELDSTCRFLKSTKQAKRTQANEKEKEKENSKTVVDKKEEFNSIKLGKGKEEKMEVDSHNEDKMILIIKEEDKINSMSKEIQELKERIEAISKDRDEWEKKYNESQTKNHFHQTKIQSLTKQVKANEEASNKLEEVKKDARYIIDQANKDAKHIKDQANSEARNIVYQAKNEAHSIRYRSWDQKSFEEIFNELEKSWGEMKKFVSDSTDFYKSQKLQELTTKLPKILKEMTDQLDEMCSQTRKRKKNDDETIELKIKLEDYSKFEWKGDTKKAKTIREGIKNLQDLNYSSLFVIRGDNYCGLRATLFSLLILIDNALKFDPIDFIELKNKNPWIKSKNEDEQMKLLLDTFQRFIEIKDPDQRAEDVRDFFTKEVDQKLMEALKLLMIVHSIKLHESFLSGEDPREFVMILFCREGMENPEELMKNSISQIGKNLGIEQIELFLLADALSINIDIYRLEKFGDSDFCLKIQTKDPKHFPELPTIPILTVDDRHYNVPF